IDLTPEEQASQKITDEDILFLANIGKRLEDHYQNAQDVERKGRNLHCADSPGNHYQGSI
ncbi:hypothetical protein ACFLXF_01750, partial [Chloroflexota bacterium]